MDDKDRDDDTAVGDDDEVSYSPRRREDADTKGDEDNANALTSLLCIVCGSGLILTFCALLAAFLLFYKTAEEQHQGPLLEDSGQGGGDNATAPSLPPMFAPTASLMPKPTAELTTTETTTTAETTSTEEPSTMEETIEPTSEKLTIKTTTKSTEATISTQETSKATTVTTPTTTTASKQSGCFDLAPVEGMESMNCYLPQYSHGPTTTTESPMPYNSLICVLDASMALTELWELPKDGICDFSFYQAYEQNRTLLEGPGGPYDATFELFLQAVSRHSKTEHGVSFDYEARNTIPKLLAEDALAQGTLAGFWKKKLYHYGFLSLPHFELDETSYKEVYQTLKKVKDFIHKGKKPARPSYFLVAGTLNSARWINETRNNIRNILHVHGVVVYGHLVHDDRGKGQILPPMFWNSSKIKDQELYPYNLDTAHWALQELSQLGLGPTQFFLSMSLGGRAYDTVDRHTFLAKSGPDITPPLWVNIGDVRTLCTNSTWTNEFHDTTPVGSFYDNANANKLVTYDNDASCRNKKDIHHRSLQPHYLGPFRVLEHSPVFCILDIHGSNYLVALERLKPAYLLCRGKKALLQVKYGLVAFHIDLDDPDDSCGKGAYAHLNFLRKVVRFFNLRFNHENNIDECNRLYGGFHRN